MREIAVEEQIQCVLLYIQGKSMDMQKENILEDLESEKIEFESVEEFLLQKEFGRGDKESVKVAELKKIEQKERIIEKFIQKFRRAVQKNSRE